MKAPLLRFAWLVLLIVQIVWYYQSYRHLAVIVQPGGGLPNDTLTNLIGIDIAGGMSWAAVLLLAEELAVPGTLAKLNTLARSGEQAKPVKVPKWLYYAGLALCIFLAIAVAYANIHAWR